MKLKESKFVFMMKNLVLKKYLKIYQIFKENLLLHSRFATVGSLLHFTEWVSVGSLLFLAFTLLSFYYGF